MITLSPSERIIYGFFKKNTTFKILKNELKKYYKFKAFYNFTKFMEALLFHPPQLILYYYSKYPEGIEYFLKDIKKRFNLVRLPICLIVDEINFKLLLKESDFVDDFIVLSETIEEVILRIEYAFKRIERISDNNPLTGLPGNTSIYQALKSVINSSKPYAVAYVDLDNFKAYNDYYGFAKGDEILRNVSRILTNTIMEYSKDDYFIGHIGGDDFVFIVPLDRIEKICREIIKRFEILVPGFVDPEDLEKGYFVCRDRQGNLKKFPLPSISIAVIPVYKGKFKHVGEIAERAAEVKKVVKKLSGSNYFIDRRK